MIRLIEKFQEIEADLSTQYLTFSEMMNTHIKFNREDSKFNISKEKVILLGS